MGVMMGGDYLKLLVAKSAGEPFSACVIACCERQPACKAWELEPGTVPLAGGAVGVAAPNVTCWLKNKAGQITDGPPGYWAGIVQPSSSGIAFGVSNASIVI